MEFNQLDVFINTKGKIALKQGNDDDEFFNVVVITADQADMVADEIKRLAKELKDEENGNQEE